MERSVVHELVEVVGVVGDECGDREVLVGAVAAAARLAAWVEARQVVLARALERVSSYPERLLADAARTEVCEAERTFERVRAAAVVPVFGEALEAGVVSGGHLDALGRVLRRLEPDQREVLAGRADELVGVAARSTPQVFARRLAAEARRLDGDGGMARLERQRGATRLATWVDPSDGMWCVSGRFDPETGVRLDARLRAMVETLFAEAVPSGVPSDPRARQDHLRALALVALTEGRGVVAGRAEMVVVVDATVVDPAGGPVVDWGLPVELPHQVLFELFGVADVAPVVVRNGVVLHAPGVLSLGRTTRLANRAQRRVLRALYPTCAVAGCGVRYDQCAVHHVIWWESPEQGRTDLDNLLPLCSKHHHAVHDHGWQLILAPDRTLTIRLPDGQVMTTGPPKRQAA